MTKSTTFWVCKLRSRFLTQSRLDICTETKGNVLGLQGNGGTIFSCVVGQCSKKVPSSCPGQVDFPVGQLTFHSHVPNGQGPRQVICQLNCKMSNLTLAQGKQNLRATCPKGKLEFKFFSSPGGGGWSIWQLLGGEKRFDDGGRRGGMKGKNLQIS